MGAKAREKNGDKRDIEKERGGGKRGVGTDMQEAGRKIQGTRGGYMRTRICRVGDGDGEEGDDIVGHTSEDVYVGCGRQKVACMPAESCDEDFCESVEGIGRSKILTVVLANGGESDAARRQR